MPFFTKANPDSHVHLEVNLISTHKQHTCTYTDTGTARNTHTHKIFGLEKETDSVRRLKH